MAEPLMTQAKKTMKASKTSLLTSFDSLLKKETQEAEQLMNSGVARSLIIIMMKKNSFKLPLKLLSKQPTNCQSI